LMMISLLGKDVDCPVQNQTWMSYRRHAHWHRVLALVGDRNMNVNAYFFC
jgi:hypothetical protein